MGYYFRKPSYSSSSYNNAQLEVSGLLNQIHKISIFLKEDIMDYNAGRARVFYDVRRTKGSVTNSGGAGLITQVDSGVFVNATDNLTVDGISVTKERFINGLSGEVIGFRPINILASDAISLFARHDEINGFYGISTYRIEIEDDNGVHTFDFVNINGNETVLTSDTGLLTMTPYNVFADNRHWVWENTDDGMNPIHNALEFDGVDDRLQLQEVVLTGDFTLEINIFTSELPDIQMLTSYAFTGNNAIFLNGTSISIRDDSGVTISSPTGSIQRGVELTLIFEKISGVVTVYANNLAIASGAFGIFKIDRVGMRGTTSFPFGGKFFNLNINNQHNYDASNPYNTSKFLMDTIGSNNAELINFSNQPYVTHIFPSLVKAVKLLRSVARNVLRNILK